jgi:hypothetical protein
MMINFLVNVYLATHFRVGFAMFILLFIEFRYFWKSHTLFVTTAEKEFLDNKILKSTQSLTQD